MPAESQSSGLSSPSPAPKGASSSLSFPTIQPSNASATASALVNAGRPKPNTEGINPTGPHDSPRFSELSPSTSRLNGGKESWQAGSSEMSSTGMQLLTPQSPANVSSGYSRPLPESPLKNSYVPAALGAAFSPRANLGEILPLEARAARRPGFIRTTSNNTSRQLTPPASSPIEPRSGARLHGFRSESPDNDSITSTPRAFSNSPPRGLEPAHVITSARSSATPTAVRHSSTPGPSSLKPIGALSSPLLPSGRASLLPAFGEPVGESHAGDSSRMVAAEDVVDDVFRVSTSKRPSRSNSFSESQPRRRPPPVGRGVDARSVPIGGSEPRPQRLKSAARPGVDSPFHDRSSRPSGPSATISLSPVKGRRIQLVRPPSPPPGSASGSAPPSPKMKTAASTPAATSSITLQWLHSSLSTPRHAKKARTPEEEAEREIKKRKRLEAFVEPISATGTIGGSGGRSKTKHKSPLKPLEVKGIGRIALHPDELKIELVTPVKRSAKKKGRRKPVDAVTPQKKKMSAFGLEVREDPLKPKQAPTAATATGDHSGSDDASESEDSIGEDPLWPDDVYPWSEGKRKVRSPAPAEKLRLQQLEAFLDRLTDDEVDSEDDFDRIYVPDPNDRASPTTDRMILTNGGNRDPPPPPPLLVRSISTASDTGDARNAISARRSAQATVRRTASEDLADIEETKPQPVVDAFTAHMATVPKLPDPESEEDEEDEGIINCVCGKDSPHIPMVRCDSCHTWSHLECMGIEDEDELGLEWYCYNCQQRKLAEEDEHYEPEPEPTFTLTSETPRPRVVGAVKFYEPSPFAGGSPVFPPNMSDIRGVLPKGPVTPKVTNTFQARLKTPSWDSIGNGAIPSQSLITPRTPLVHRPLDMRMYTTPKFFPDHDRPPPASEAFDPLSTPSRGLQLGTPFHQSASSDRHWSSANQPPSTPTHRILPDRSFGHRSGASGRPTRPLTFYPQDGSPFPGIAPRGITSKTYDGTSKGKEPATNGRITL